MSDILNLVQIPGLRKRQAGLEVGAGAVLLNGCDVVKKLPLK